MSFLTDLDLDRLGPVHVWRSLDVPVRELAARAMWTSEDDDVRLEASMTLTQQLRFRPQYVAKLPLVKRVGYLARQVRVDDALAGSLLLALHLGERRLLLVAFLDALAIPHEDGIIDEDYDLLPPDSGPLTTAVAALDEQFPQGAVDLYLATLLAIDPDTWGPLRKVLEERSAA